MSYTPTTWANGDTITAVKLNNMEQGIANAGGGALLVTATGSGYEWTCDKTASEMWSAYQSGVLLIKQGEVISLVTCAWLRSSDGKYFFYIADPVNIDTTYTFQATSGSDYPACD